MQTQYDEKRIIDFDKFRHRSYIDYQEAARKIGIAAIGKATAFVSNVHAAEHDCHTLANGFMVQLFDASELAPGDLKNKVLAFQDEVKTFAVHILRTAKKNEAQRIGLLLEAHGHSTAASLVRSTQLLG